MGDDATRPLENGWLPDTPVGDTVLRRFVHNQAEVNEAFATARGGRVHRVEGLSAVDGGPVTGFLNQAVLLRPLESADDGLLDEVDEAHAAHGGLMVSVWPTPDLRPRGWHLVGHPTFVVRSPAPAPEDRRGAGGRDGADEVTVTEVASVDDLRRLEQVVVEGYPIDPAGDGAPTFADAVIGGPLHLRTASVRGAAVAAGVSHVAHGVVNLCLAATLPAARRKGAWAALVWARVADDPTLPAVAFTSDFSRPGFERMGFLPLTRFTLWSVPPGQAGPLG